MNKIKCGFNSCDEEAIEDLEVDIEGHYKFLSQVCSSHYMMLLSTRIDELYQIIFRGDIEGKKI